MPLSSYIPHRQRYKSGAFDADGYPPPPSRRNDYSRKVDEDACFSDCSAATFTDSEGASDNRDNYRGEPKSTRPRRFNTEDDSSKPHNKHRPKEPGEQAKGRTSTNTAGTERAYSKSHSSRTKSPARPMESQPEAKVDIRLPPGTALSLTRDSELRIITPADKSTGRSTKTKSKGASRANQGKEGNNEKARKSSQSSEGTELSKVNAVEPPRGNQNTERSIIKTLGPSRGSRSTKPSLPDYYAVIHCTIDDTLDEINKKAWQKERALLSRRNGPIPKQERAKLDAEINSVVQASDVLEDEVRRLDYDQKWLSVYGKRVSR